MPNEMYGSQKIVSIQCIFIWFFDQYYFCCYYVFPHHSWANSSFTQKLHDTIVLGHSPLHYKEGCCFLMINAFISNTVLSGMTKLTQHICCYRLFKRSYQMGKMHRQASPFLYCVFFFIPYFGEVKIQGAHGNYERQNSQIHSKQKKITKSIKN